LKSWNARVPAIRNQALLSLAIFCIGLWVAYQVGQRVAAEDLVSIEFTVLGFAGCVAAVAILRRWRSGFYMFMAWLLLEDLVRKYMGNGLALFFGKDILCGLTYISLFVAIRKGQERSFRPAFLAPLALFVWLGVLEIFNQHSPHVLYGLLGFKTYYYYIPLMFVGYALVRTDEDLRKFLVANAAFAGVIALLGVIQAVVGHSFLNPEVLAPELRDLGELDKVSPISGQVFSLPASVFVSSGRFAFYLIVAICIALGTVGYLLLHSKRGRLIALLSLGLVLAGTLFSGSRGGLLYVLATCLALPAAFIWGAPWRWRQAHRMVKAIRRSVIFGGLGLAAFFLLFPEAAAPRMAFYLETLLPSSSTYELGLRTWDYPIQNFMGAFDNPHWLLGNGIGTTSLGKQYVARLTGAPQPNIGVEEGYGQLIIEMGILAPLLWLLWTAVLLYSGWKVVRSLKQTRFFPIGIAILWYAFLLLYPLTYGGLAGYQNYVNCAYLWLLVGVLFRLPHLQAANPGLASVPHGKASRGGFQF
jgi:hypothetical protein